MMRLWTDSYLRGPRIGGAAAASTVAHALIIAASVAATLPSASMPGDSIANRIFYLPPPDKPPTIAGSIEIIRYINVGAGLGFGPGPASLDARLPVAPTERSTIAGAGEARTDSVSVVTPAGNSDTKTDSVFTILEVDTAVARSANSAAPAYPLELLKKRIEGMVRVRYIVDTTGFADPASLEVIEVTHPEFLAAVRDVLPYMRFAPAKIGTRKVRQLVEQPFSFHITAPEATRARTPD